LEKGETSTALIGIRAVGDTSPPMIIQQGKSNKIETWSNGAMHNTLVQASKKGYINKELFLEFVGPSSFFFKITILWMTSPTLLSSIRTIPTSTTLNFSN